LLPSLLETQVIHHCTLHSLRPASCVHVGHAGLAVISAVGATASRNRLLQLFLCRRRTLHLRQSVWPLLYTPVVFQGQNACIARHHCNLPPLSLCCILDFTAADDILASRKAFSSNNAASSKEPNAVCNVTPLPTSPLKHTFIRQPPHTTRSTLSIGDRMVRCLTS